MAKAGVYISVIGDSNVAVKNIAAARKELELLERQSNTASVGLGKGWTNAAKTMSSVGTKMTIGLTLPIAAAGVASFKLASDLEESMSKVGVVFDRNAKKIVSWSEDSDTALGLSQQQALEAAGTFGNLFRAMDVGLGAATKMSKGIIGLSADLASFNNADPTEVLEALRSGLVGETEPLRKFGINLSAARIEAKAFEMGLADTKDQLTAGGKAQAAYALIMEDSVLAHGDFARTSEGAANQQRILMARVRDLGAELGAKLLPLGTQAVGVISDLADAFLTLPDWAQDFAIGGLAVAAAIGPLLKMTSVIITLTDRTLTWARSNGEAATGLQRATAAAVPFTGRILTAGAAAAVGAASFSMIGTSTAGSISGIVGMTAAGAALGSVIPGVGTGVGALAGGIVGLGTAMFRGGESADDYRRRIGALGSELESLGAGRAARKFLDELHDLDAIRGLLGDLDELTDKLTTLAAKSPAAAQKVVQGLADMRTEAGKPIFDQAQFDKLDAAVQRGVGRYKDHVRAGHDAAATNDQVAQSALGVADAADTAADAADGFRQKLDELAGGHLNLEEATIRYRGSIDEIHASLFENSATLDINTEAGRRNREAITQSTSEAYRLAEALVKQQGDTSGATMVLHGHIDALTGVMRQAGFTEDQIQDYLHTLGLTPEQVDTLVQAHNTEAATGQIDAVNNALDQIPPTKDVRVNVTVESIARTIADNYAAYFKIGGYVDAPRDQAVPAILHGGEYVLSADVVDRIQNRHPSRGADMDPGLAASSTGATPPRAGGQTIVHKHYHLTINGATLQPIDEERIVELLEHIELMDAAHG